MKKFVLYISYIYRVLEKQIVINDILNERTENLDVTDWLLLLYYQEKYFMSIVFITNITKWAYIMQINLISSFSLWEILNEND